MNSDIATFPTWFSSALQDLCCPGCNSDNFRFRVLGTVRLIYNNPRDDREEVTEHLDSLREYRCDNCDHVWFQQGETDDHLLDQDDEEEEQEVEGDW